ncbi:MAG: flagellar biosynthesis protein FlhB [Armatimonadetes bacterium]|nr:flagellar biosynthesis protein FlhB [Armatimonadota bacterium]
MSSQRTEAATPRRRTEARQRGNVARSQDLASSVSLLAGLAAGAITLPYGIRAFSAYMVDTVASAATAATTAPAFHTVFGVGAWAGARLLGPVLLASGVAGIVVNLAQTGGLFTFKPVEPQLDRLNPVRALARLFSLRTLAESIKSIAKLTALTVIITGAVRNALPSLPGAVTAGPGAMLALLGSTMFGVAVRGAVALVVIGALDYMYQRFEWERSLRMTKQEVKEDLRETEGDPLVRSRIRSRQRDLARRRMMADVPKATVVVTNPTHIAVALRYQPREMAAPVVVAKGAQLIAERIKQIAARHGVPVVENQPLARALFKSVPIGKPIPPALYHAVAEVLAMIYRLARQRGVRA